MQTKFAADDECSAMVAFCKHTFLIPGANYLRTDRPHIEPGMGFYHL